MVGLTGSTWVENLRTVWAAEALSPERLIPGGAKVAASQFFAEDSVLVDVGAAGAAAGATSIPVVALSGPIPSGTLLDFGTNKFARLTASAAAGAVTLTVAAIPTALVDADVARYVGAGVKKKRISSGTLIGRTYTERDAGTGYGPWATGDDEVYLVAFEIVDADANPNVELVAHGTKVYENRLPGWAGSSAGFKAAVRAAYQTMLAPAG